MLLGCIADDFTGASDLANTLAKGGMSTIQFSGIPEGNAPRGCDAGVVALKTRSVAVEDAVRQSLAALGWLRAQGCKQFVFKYCSTFDSTPEGNIGPVAEALLDELGETHAVVCPAFPATGRTIYMGHLFVGDRLLNESGMERHPLNPMTDADLRRWLSRQTAGDIGHVAYDKVRQGPSAIADALQGEAQVGRRLIIVDAVEDRDLFAIGTAIKDRKLVTGGSGIALGLPDNFRRSGELSPSGLSFVGSDGPGVVLSGSCSTASQLQVSEYLKDHPGLAVEPSKLVVGEQSVGDALEFVLGQRGRNPIVYSTASPAAIAETQARFGQKEIAERIEHFFGTLAARLVEAGVSRVVVGGGETSGAVVGALKANALRIGPEIDPGIPALSVDDGPVRLALKSGNFGSADFYTKALRILGLR